MLLKSRTSLCSLMLSEPPGPNNAVLESSLSVKAFSAVLRIDHPPRLMDIKSVAAKSDTAEFAVGEFCMAAYEGSHPQAHAQSDRECEPLLRALDSNHEKNGASANATQTA